MDHPALRPLPWLTARLMPALLGLGVAALLGASGFGLGCLYAQLDVPAPEASRVAQHGGAERGWEVPAWQAAPVPAAPVTAAPAMGGPEDAGPFERAPRTARQASATGVLATLRPVAGGWVSSHYGQRLDPFTGRPAVHRGLDFAGLDNSAILAVAPGVVAWSGRQRGYGNLIEIDHGNGWVTRYGHNAFNLVAPGDYVKPGQTIALMGSTGRATGTHLHFEVLYRGRHQNPARFVPQDA